MVPVGAIVLVFFVTGVTWVSIRGLVTELVAETAVLPHGIVDQAVDVIFVTIAALVLQVVLRRRVNQLSTAGAPSHLAARGLAASENGDILQNTALATTAEAVVVTAPDGTIEWVNAAFETMTGYPAAVAIGGTPRLLNSGVHDPEFFQNLWETVSSGQVWSEEVTNRRSDGRLYTIRQTITPVLDERGAIQNFVAVHENVTERLRSAQEVEASRLRMEVLFDRAIDAIVLVDDKGRYLDVNPAMCEMSAYSHDELLQLTTSDLVAPDQPSDDLAEQKQSAGFAAGRAKSGTFILRRKEGGEIETEYRTSFDVQPGVHLVVVRDVTARNSWLRSLNTPETAFQELAETTASTIAYKLGEVPDRRTSGDRRRRSRRSTDT